MVEYTFHIQHKSVYFSRIRASGTMTVFHKITKAFFVGNTVWRTLMPLAVMGILLAPDRVWALQVHPHPEGLVAHQLAHIFFSATMVVLAYWLQVNQFVQERGWRFIQISCLLFLLWNIDAFSGHLIARHLPNEMFVGEPRSLSRKVLLGQSAWVLPYFILHLDHFICVPAILCLLLGIRSLYRKVLDEDKAGV